MPKEAAIVNQMDVIGVDNLQEAVEFINGTRQIEPLFFDTREEFAYQQTLYDRDFSDVRGQQNIKRALGNSSCRRP